MAAKAALPRKQTRTFVGRHIACPQDDKNILKFLYKFVDDYRKSETTFHNEYLSSGRTIDYAETIFLTAGHPFYSNRSNIMFDILTDTVRRHYFLLTLCSADTFRIIYGPKEPHRGCFGNLSQALAPFGINSDSIPVCFNIFMHVTVDGETGVLMVLPPKSRAVDHIIIEARMDLIIGMTACSAEMSNNYSFKSIAYQII